MKLLSLILLVVLSFKSFSEEIDETSCPNIDYTNRFPPIQDQDGHGLCWAFSTSALLSEISCLKDPNLCGVNISPLDISTCEKKFMSPIEVGSFAIGISCALKKGACFESNFSYISGVNQICKYVKYGEGPKCMHNALKELYLRFQEIGINKNNCEEKMQQANISSELDQLAANMKSLLLYSSAQYLINEDQIKKILFEEENSDWQSFMYNILQNKKCQQNRLSFSSIEKIKTSNLIDPKMNLLSKVKTISDYLKNGISMEYSFCAKRAMYDSWMNHLLGSNTDCGRHSVVINGMRWNDHLKRCEVNIRNSWGYGALFQGWTSAKSALKYSVEINQIVEKK